MLPPNDFRGKGLVFRREGVYDGSGYWLRTSARCRHIAPLSRPCRRVRCQPPLQLGIAHSQRWGCPGQSEASVRMGTARDARAYKARLVRQRNSADAPRRWQDVKSHPKPSPLRLDRVRQVKLQTDQKRENAAARGSSKRSRKRGPGSGEQNRTYASGSEVRSRVPARSLHQGAAI